MASTRKILPRIMLAGTTASLLVFSGNSICAQNSTATIRPAEVSKPLLRIHTDSGHQVEQAAYAVQEIEPAKRPDLGKKTTDTKTDTQSSPSDRIDDSGRSDEKKSDEVKAEAATVEDLEADSKASEEKDAKSKAAKERESALERARQRAKDRAKKSRTLKKAPKFDVSEKIQKDFKPISELTVDIREKADKKPEDRSIVFVGEYPLGDNQKPWVDRTLLWEPSNLAYNPLYFQETQLERYGQHASPLVQSFFSGAVFANSFIALPINVFRHSPNACVYPVNYPQPGECVPFQYNLPHICE